MTAASHEPYSTASLRIEGRVQGVGYRAWLQAAAAAEQLDGWVRNRRDGSVEALVAGQSAAIDRLVERCRRGPALARVERVIRNEASAIPASGFQVLATR